jgi:hypothetical protein
MCEPKITRRNSKIGATRRRDEEDRLFFFIFISFVCVITAVSMDVLENWRAIEFTSLIILHSSCTEALHHIEEGPRRP